jgi:hypothetical protein
LEENVLVPIAGFIEQTGDGPADESRAEALFTKGSNALYMAAEHWRFLRGAAEEMNTIIDRLELNWMRDTRLVKQDTVCRRRMTS